MFFFFFKSFKIYCSISSEFLIRHSPMKFPSPITRHEKKSPPYDKNLWSWCSLSVSDQCSIISYHPRAHGSKIEAVIIAEDVDLIRPPVSASFLRVAIKAHLGSARERLHCTMLPFRIGARAPDKAPGWAILPAVSMLELSAMEGNRDGVLFVTTSR